jgi:type IV secretory pathway VirD2 relaxase
VVDNEDDFRIRLGRIGHRRGRKAVNYVERVRKVANQVALGQPRRACVFTGSRIGRGYAQGTVAAGRRPRGQRRVVIKTRIVRIKTGDTGAVRAHLRYVQRDGVTREGAPGELYDKGHDRADGKAFAERVSCDRHQFRFIVAAEDAADLADLKPFVRDLMLQVETDLGTRLDWVAADHFNTGHPHSHIVVRGKDDRGRDLVIARDYIAHGMRVRAGELLTRELGPESELDQLRKLEHEVHAERFTRLDRGVLRDAGDGVLALAARPERDPRRHALRMGRLRVLERMGLAEETAAGIWRIAPDLEPILRRIGERGDIIKTMHRELKAAGIERAASDHLIFDPASDRRVVGRLVAEGFSDELRERRYVIVDGVDGRTHYVELGFWNADDTPLVRNMIIELRAREGAPRAVDQTIAEISSRNHGLYSTGLHRDADPGASAEFVQSHIRRLEAMRRQGLAERLADGGWRVGLDHLDRAARFEEANRLRRPVRMTVLSWQNLESLPDAVGATWLDRQLVAKAPEAIAPRGMGSELGAALTARRRWLLDQGFAREEGGRVSYARNLLQTLERRELAEVAARIASETGLDYVGLKQGDRLNGTYRRMLTLNSGRFALIERAHDFALVPWRPVLERARGQVVSGSVGGEGVSWSIGNKRGIGR